MKYITLQAGDVRQEGDETMRKEPYENHFSFSNESDPYHQDQVWLPVRLLGHKIQSTDLHISSYRRPV